MALFFMDGMANGTARWSFTSNANLASTSPRLTGGSYIVAGSSSGFVLNKSFTAVSELFVGAGLYTGSISSFPWFIFMRGDNNTTTHLTLTLNAGGTLKLFRGGSSGTVIANGTTILSPNAWNFIEFRATIADSGGICQVRINGSTTNDIDFNGDTRNGGTATSLDTIEFSANGAINPGIRVTDVNMRNTSGSVNNTWLGDVTVRTLTPNGNGTDSQLTGSDSDQVNNYQQVDELPASSTDYNASATSGQRDTYSFSDLPGGVSNIYALQTTMYAAKSDATAASAKSVVRTGGTNYYGATQTLTTSFVNYTDIFETNPNTTLAWTVSDVNGVESGMEVV